MLRLMHDVVMKSQATSCAAALQVETRITCPLSAMQTFWYRRLLTRDSKMLTNIEAEYKEGKEKEVNVRHRPRHVLPATLTLNLTLIEP